MEIKDYLKVLGKRAWLLVMIPAVAGVVAGLIAVRQPQAFRTTATLQLPHDEKSSPAEVAQLVADFRAASGNPTVQNQVSEDTAVSIKRIKRLKITQVGDSSQLTLGFQDKKRNATDAKAVIDGVARGALEYLEAPEVRSANKAVDAAEAKINQAQSGLDTANEQLTTLYTTVQSSTPIDDIASYRRQSEQLNLSLVKSLADGNSAAAEVYRKNKEAVDLKIVALLGVQTEVTSLQAKAAVAATALTAAQAELQAAQEQLTNITSEPDMTFSAEGQPVVRKTRVVKTAAAAVVAGFPIAVGLVLLLDALQKRRQNRPRRPSHEDGLDDEGAEDLEHAAAPVPAATPALVGASAVAAAPALDGEEDQLDDDWVDEDDRVEEVRAEVPAAIEDDEDDLEADEGDVEVLDGDLDDGDLDEAEVLDGDLDDGDLDEAEVLDEQVLDDEDLDEAEVLDDEDLDDEDLEDEDLDDFDDELDEDVEATVASRRRMYEADIDDDLSVDGGHADRNGRVRARVPAADEDFDDDDEDAGSDL